MSGIAGAPPTRRGVCLVISAPSGAGKSTIMRALLHSEPELTVSISATTRAPRPGERDGDHYLFRSTEAFAAMVEAGEFLEWAEVFSRRYGTPRAPVEQALAAGRDVAFDIDWQGHRQVRAALPGDVVSVFVLPPSLVVLEERLHARAGDDPAEIARRMRAAQAEIAHWPEFDYTVINDRLDDALATVRCVLQAARCATVRQPGLAAFVAGLATTG